MESIALCSILLSILINLLESIFSTAGAFNDSYYLPDFIGIAISALQVLFPLLAMIFSLINYFKNKISTNLQKILLIIISTALFFANINWLITWFIPYD